MSLSKASQYHQGCEKVYQSKILPAFWAAKERAARSGNPDDALPFVEIGRSLPDQNDSQHKAFGPAVFLVTTELNERPDYGAGRSGVVSGECWLRHAGENLYKGTILIASSTSITVGGLIDASGGTQGSGCNASGAGSGGAIRLVANTIGGGGSIRANGVNACCGIGTSGSAGGRVRLEAFQNFGGSVTGGSVAYSVPFALALPTSAPGAITVTSVNGIPINANPFSFPDVTISTATAVTINIQAQYIPPGTVPSLIVFSENGSDQTIACSPLTGTLQSSTSTATVTFPTGGSRGFVKATWTQ